MLTLSWPIANDLFWIALEFDIANFGLLRVAGRTQLVSVKLLSRGGINYPTVVDRERRVEAKGL